MRNLATICLYFVFSWAFLRAPFQHVHDHDSAVAQTGGLWHAHFHVTPAQVSLEEPNPHHDSSLDWFNQANGSIIPFCPNSIRLRSIVPSTAIAWIVPTLTPRAHDPPLASRLVPRAPPL